MAPLIVLVLVTLGLLAVGAAGVRQLRLWPVALRGGLAAMFVVTGVSHFVGLRQALAKGTPWSEELVDSLVATGHPSTPGYNDPAYPIEGRPTWTAPAR